nr:boron transporter 4-like [Tanacetum cinerariifolium]
MTCAQVNLSLERKQQDCASSQTPLLHPKVFETPGLNIHPWRSQTPLLQPKVFETPGLNIHPWLCSNKAKKPIKQQVKLHTRFLKEYTTRKLCTYGKVETVQPLQNLNEGASKRPLFSAGICCHRNPGGVKIVFKVGLPLLKYCHADLKEFNLKNPSAYHYDILFIGFMTLLCGLLESPPSNGVLPQLPMHTKSLDVPEKQFIRKKLIVIAKESIKREGSNPEIYNKMETVFIEIDSSPITTAIVKELKYLHHAVMKVDIGKENTDGKMLNSIKKRMAPHFVGHSLARENVVPLYKECDGVRDGLRLLVGPNHQAIRDHVDFGIVRIEDEVPAIVAEKSKGSKKKRKAVGGASGSNLPPKKLKEDKCTSSVGGSTGKKSVAALQSLLECNTLAVKFGVTGAATVSFVTSLMTPTLEHEGRGHTDSVSGSNQCTQHPAKRFPVSDPPVMTVASVTTTVANISSILVPESRHEPFHHTLLGNSASIGKANLNIYVPKWNVINGSTLDDPDIYRSTPNVTGSEVRLRFEHNLREKKKLERRCSRQADLLKEKDVEIANLKSELSLREVEAAKEIRLRGQVATIKAAEATRASELDGLKDRKLILEEVKHALEEKVTTLESGIAAKEIELSSLTTNTAQLTHDLSILQASFDELTIKVASLESEKDNLANQASSLEATCFELHDQVDKVAGLDTELMVMALHLDEEFYPYFLTTIARRRWILSCDLKLVVMQCSQSPKDLAALGGGGISRAIDKVMQDGIRRDVASRCLSISDVMVYLIEPLSAENLTGSVPPISMLDYEVLNAKPQAEVPPSTPVVFDKEELETMP